MRAFGLTLARAVPTASELARGPPPAMRRPLMRQPPSFGGHDFDARTLALFTESGLRADRFALEQDAAEAAPTTFRCAEGDDRRRPEMMML